MAMMQNEDRTTLDEALDITDVPDASPSPLYTAPSPPSPDSFPSSRPRRCSRQTEMHERGRRIDRRRSRQRSNRREDGPRVDGRRGGRMEWDWHGWMNSNGIWLCTSICNQHILLSFFAVTIKVDPESGLGRNRIGRVSHTYP